jgi:hypothetical protein
MATEQEPQKNVYDSATLVIAKTPFDFFDINTI